MGIHPSVLILLTTAYGLAQPISNWQAPYLDNYRFIPILGNCYQFYENNDLTSTCRRDPNLKNQACIQWIPGDKKCLGIITPTNETVLFRCTFHIRFDLCYEVYDSNYNLSIVCQESFDGTKVGITTPDNFTILIHDDMCTTTANLMERQVHHNFLNNFSLDPETRSCYKVYNVNEAVSPYNCLSRDIYETCVFNLEEECTAITTQNNEVIILDCPDESEKPKEKNCFYVYTPDSQIHTVCQEKLEERCIGIVTPSNLTVLFECFFCSEFMKISYHNKELQRRYRQFVKKYIENEYAGRNSYEINTVYKVFDKDGSANVLESSWIPKTSCLGFRLDSNETVVLECFVRSEKQEQPGCFPLITQKNEKQSVCAEILNEACVGLKTPDNFSVALDCYHTAGYYRAHSIPQPDYILRLLLDFTQNRFTFQIGDAYVSYKEQDEVNQNHPDVQSKTYKVEKLNHKLNCLGIVRETEVIILKCADQELEENGCFNVTKRAQGYDSNGANTTTEIHSLCVKVLDSDCVGLITSDNWIIRLRCGYELGVHGSAVSSQPGFISDNIRKNGPPERY